jgi:hypothetical protein
MDEKLQLLLRVRQSRYYALQADESTDTVNADNLLLCVGCELNGEDHGDILFCQPLRKIRAGQAIFKVIDDFIKASHLDWGRYVRISTDGARAMTGARKGVVTHIEAAMIAKP